MGLQQVVDTAVGDVITLATTSGSGSGAKCIVAAIDGSNGVTEVYIPNNASAELDMLITIQLLSQPLQVQDRVFAAVVNGVTSTTTTDNSRTALGLFKGNGTNSNTFRVGVLDKGTASHKEVTQLTLQLMKQVQPLTEAQKDLMTLYHQQNGHSAHMKAF